MNRHPVVLELGVKPLAVCRGECQLLERIDVREKQYNEEKRQDRL